MKIITIASKQVAAGKSALAVHLAHYLRDLGKSVLVIDLAYTDSTSRTLAEFAGLATVPEIFDGKIVSHAGRRKTPRIELIRSDLDEDLARWRLGDFGIPIESAFHRLHKALASFAPHFDYCVVDTAPGLCVRAQASLVAANMVVIPIVPVAGAVEQADQFTVDMAVLSIRFHEVRKTPRPVLIVPSRYRPAMSQAQATHATFRQQFPNVFLDTPIAESAAIPAALCRKRPVWALRTRSSRRPTLHMRAALEAVVARVNAF